MNANMAGVSEELKTYEKRFKALADYKRLQLLYLLTQQGWTCVCDLVEQMEIPQSKLSYHLKILLDAQLLLKENRGTWSYYKVNNEEAKKIISSDLCCFFHMNKTN